MNFTGSAQIFNIDPKSTEASQSTALGTKGLTPDGRIFRYAKAGASAITAGKLQLGPARKTNHDNIAVAAAAAIGARQVTVTLGATLAAVNEYAGGYLVTSDATGEGTCYVIASHPAAAQSASLVLTLEEPINEALTTSSEVCLVHNRFNAVVEGTVQAGGIVAGVPLVDVAAGNFFWAQTFGVAPVLADEAGTVNQSVTVGSSTAGAVEEKDDMLNATDGSRFDSEPVVGYQIVAMVDTEYRPIFLTLES